MGGNAFIPVCLFTDAAGGGGWGVFGFPAYITGHMTSIQGVCLGGRGGQTSAELGKRAVCILLECFLVLIYFHIFCSVIKFTILNYYIVARKPDNGENDAIQNEVSDLNIVCKQS